MKRRVWVGLLAAPAAWAIDELVSVFAHEGLCSLGPVRMLGIASPRVVLVITGVLAIIAGSTGLLVARNAVAATAEMREPGPEVADQAPFLARFGLLFSTIFLFGLVLRFITAFFISPCHYQ